MLSFINVSFDPAMMRSTFMSGNWDTFLILLFAFLVLVYSFFVNRERLAVVLLSLYATIAIVMGTPVITNALATFPLHEMYNYRLGIFGALFVILYLLLSNNMSLRSEMGHSWWQAVILSFMQVGLLMSSVLLLLPREQITSMIATYYFTSDIPRSFWLLAPILSMIIMRRRHRPQSGNPMMS